MNERYEGNRGRTHGERNEKSPAVKATSIERFAARLTVGRLLVLL